MPVEEAQVGEVTIRRVNKREYTHGPYDPVRCSACDSEAVVTLKEGAGECMSLCEQCIDEVWEDLRAFKSNT